MVVDALLFVQGLSLATQVVVTRSPAGSVFWLAASSVVLLCGSHALKSIVLVSFCTRACAFLQSLETPGYKNVVAYTTMITLLGKQRRVQQARELFLQLANAGLPMDVVVYNALLDALAKGGEWETAHRVFKGMLRSGPVPTVYTYSILVDM